MISYIIRRLLLMIAVVLLIVTFVFLLLRLAPGDPTTAVLGEYAGEEARQALRERLGLNKPLYSQYFNFVKDVFSFRPGKSLITGQPVLEEFFSVIGYSLELALSSLVIAISVGISGGFLAFIYSHTSLDHLFRIVTLFWTSLPSYVLGVLLIMVFSTQLGWLPSSGTGTGFLGRMVHLIMPAISLGVYVSGYIARVTRASMMEISSEDYIQTARAKGLNNTAVLFKHVLRNSLIPVITIIGVYVPVVLGGTIVIEAVFVRSGVGSLLLTGVLNRDYTSVQFTIVVFAFIVCTVNLLVDLTYAWFDPRVRYS